MKITKFEHACLVVEERGKRLIIDPSGMTRDMGGVENVVAVVFTHVHFDHFAGEQVASIVARNPGAQFFGTDEVSAASPNVQITAVHTGNVINVEPFSLQFFGEKHALVTGSKPDNQNVGVLVNGKLYYPGDSFETPGGAHPEVLALPVSGPWLKIGESINFLRAVHPTRSCFPTHDALYSEAGQKIAENWLPDVCAELGVELKIVRPGESFEA